MRLGCSFPCSLLSSVPLFPHSSSAPLLPLHRFLSSSRTRMKLAAAERTEARSVAEAFRATALRFPDRPALSPIGFSAGSPEATITYRQLDRVSEACSSAYFKKGQVVVVGVDEGRDLVAIELAAWKAGAAVCPFDLKKDPRSVAVLQRLHPDLVVLANHDDTIHPWSFKTCKSGDLLDWTLASAPDENVQALQISDANRSEEDEIGALVSHLVFTSGTTGQPKCVGVTNASLLEFARAKVGRSGIDERSKMFLASSFTFDPQLGDVACALISGACLILPSRQALLNGKLGELLVESKATHVCTTPAALSMLSDTVRDESLCVHLRELLVGGEKMPPQLIERAIREWLPRNTRLVNTYGVTECCVYQATKEIRERGDESLLGDAYSDVEIRLYTFDSSGRPHAIVNPDEEGEIVMKGSLLGLGYLQDPSRDDDLHRSAKKTRDDVPFDQAMTGVSRIPQRQLSFEKVLGFHGDLYRTGDLGKYVTTREGKREIYFLGRRDAQFKINGIRIEAGEVEYALNTKTGGIVNRSVAINLDGKLVAAIVLNQLPRSMASGPQMATKAPSFISVCLQRYLSKCLPAAYIPSTFFVVDAIPLSSTGKIERNLLAEWIRNSSNGTSPTGTTVGTHVESSVEDDVEEEEEDGDTKLRSDLERFIAKTWTDILGIPSVDPTDSFVALGGDSLQALKAVNHVLSWIRERYESESRPLEQDPILHMAISEAQAFGEIQGPFSAVTLLSSPSLRAYTKQLELVVARSELLVSFTKRDEDGASDQKAVSNDPVQEQVDAALDKALMDAARSGYVQCVRAILNLGIVSPDGRFIPRKRMCRTPLHEAARMGHVDVAQLLLEEHKARAMVVTELRVSPLHLAAMLDDPECLRVLIKHTRAQREDIKPLLIEDKNKQTPLHYAARLGRNRIIQALIDEQVEADRVDPKYVLNRGMLHAINMFDRWRRTPLHWAVVNLHTTTCRLLLDLGADVIPEGMKIGRPGPGTHLVQETPLQVAVRRNAPRELIELLTDAENRSISS